VAVSKTTFTSAEALGMTARLKMYTEMNFILHKAEFKIINRKL
jgi:hypothetical protein